MVNTSQRELVFNLIPMFEKIRLNCKWVIFAVFLQVFFRSVAPINAAVRLLTSQFFTNPLGERTAGMVCEILQEDFLRGWGSEKWSRGNELGSVVMGEGSAFVWCRKHYDPRSLFNGCMCGWHGEWGCSIRGREFQKAGEEISMGFSKSLVRKSEFGVILAKSSQVNYRNVNYLQFHFCNSFSLSRFIMPSLNFGLKHMMHPLMSFSVFHTNLPSRLQSDWRSSTQSNFRKCFIFLAFLGSVATSHRRPRRRKSAQTMAQLLIPL